MAFALVDKTTVKPSAVILLVDDQADANSIYLLSELAKLAPVPMLPTSGPSFGYVRSFLRQKSFKSTLYLLLSNFRGALTSCDIEPSSGRNADFKLAFNIRDRRVACDILQHCISYTVKH